MTKASTVPIIVGEVLWDCLIDSSTEKITRRILGGAPLNVAWNLAGFGLEPLLITAVGDDELGREIIQTMNDWGMNCQGVSVLPNRATGQVRVTMVNGEPSYEITENVAYDAIPLPNEELDAFISNRVDQFEREARQGPSSGDSDCLPRRLLYHGSLAYRDKRSRETINQLRRHADQSVFLDVNLRPPHYKQDWFSTLLPTSQIVKLNQDELEKITSLPVTSDAEIEHASQQLLHQLDRNSAETTALLLVTLGPDGAIAFTPESPSGIRVKAPTPEKFVDPVGAGDAFASVVMHGMLTQRDTAEYLNDAVEFASRVCGLSGATTNDPSFYQIFSSS